MGLEPTTFWMQTRRSSQLSYVPVNRDGQASERTATRTTRYHRRVSSRAPS